MTARERTARREGYRAAQRAHAALGLPLDRPVDIFQIIQDEGIWLMFQPMAKAYGVFLNMYGQPGVLINSRHPLSLQRFTAAHEFGHFTMGHAPSLDREEEIETGASDVLNEISANAFAAEFLMPLGLVNRCLKQLKLGLKPRGLRPLDVYRMSLLLGASYQATIFHLVGQNKLRLQDARYLRAVTPKEIKRSAAQRSLEDPWADCWFLDKDQDGSRIFPRIGDEVCIRLPATPSAGYVWQIDSGSNTPSATTEVQVIHQSFRSSVAENVGSPGMQDLAIRVDDSTGEMIELRRGRPWDPAPTDERFQVKVEIASKPLTGRDRGLADRQLLSA